MMDSKRALAGPARRMPDQAPVDLVLMAKSNFGREQR